MNDNNFDKLKGVFRSRKFWASIIAAVSAIAAFILGEIEAWQFIQALVAIAAAYSTGVAIEDAGLGIGGTLTR